MRGNRPAALEQRNRLLAVAKANYVPAYAIALAYYATSDSGKGHTWLRKAWDDRNGTLVWLGRTAMFDGARQNPRSRQLLDHTGDPQFQP